MGQTLMMLSDRVAIGRVDQSGAVRMTLEFARMLSDLHARVGGTAGASTEDLSVELAHSSLVALGHSLDRTAADLQLQVLELAGHFEHLAELRKALGALERAGAEVPPPTDWEHPGKIGAATPNSGKFTTLEALDLVKLNPKDKNVEIKPTGTALLTVQPAAVGQVDNVELGKTAPAPARVTTLNKITFTEPAVNATLTLANGKTLTVANTLSFSGNDGAGLNIGAGGTLGSAAYASAGAFAARSATALASVATDPATTQALANSLRSVLLSVGIGT